MHAIIVIPTYNEAENIGPLLSAIFGLNMGLHVLVVDDNSPDHTAHIVTQLQDYYPNQLHLLHRARKEGLGKAYLAGFRWALSYDYAYICSMDGDFSHAPTDLARLLTHCRKDKWDIVIGSRYVAGGGILHWPYSRILLSRTANKIAQYITGMKVKDSTAGLVCYSRVLLQAILQEDIISRGYSFQVEMKFLAYQRGSRLIELPIIFTNRVRGTSKMNLKIAGESFWHLLKMKWRSWIRQ